MPDTSTACIVLAAGSSSRMGKAKQLLELNGQALVARMCHLAQEAGFESVIAVTGARQRAVEEALPGFVQAVYNPDWASGMGSSVYTGLSFALELIPELEYAGFILTDQPFLSSSLLHKMLSRLRQSDKPGIAGSYRGGLGVPAVFRRLLFPELLALNGKKGAKPVLQKYHESLLSFPFPDGDFDLDYPEDWDQFLKRIS